MTEASRGEPLLIHRVIARLNVGGPAIHVVNLAHAMNSGRWRTRLVAGRVPDTEADMAYYAADQGVEVTYLTAMSREIRPLDDLRTFWRLLGLFRRERPRVVHTHTAKAGTLGRLAAILAGVPVRVHTYHGHVLGGSYFSPAKTRFFLGVERLLGRWTSRLVVLTERQAAEMAEDLGVAPRARFQVVPLGLELDRFVDLDREAARTEARGRLGLGEDELLLGIVGRMVPVKNHELFLQVLAEVRRSRSRAAGIVVGSGEREAELRGLATRLGLDGHVRWLGWRTDLEDLYPAMDALLLTSHDEGTPVAVIEALAAGTRVAARDVGGVAEVLGELEAGVVVAGEAGPAQWAEAILAVVESPPPSSERRHRVRERFSVERLTRDLERLYLEAGAEG